MSEQPNHLSVPDDVNQLFVTIENANKKCVWTVDQYTFEDIDIEYEEGYRWGLIDYVMTQEQYNEFLDLFPNRDPLLNEDTHNMFDFPGDADSPELNDGCWDGIDASFITEDQEDRFYEEKWNIDSEQTDYFITGPIKVTVDYPWK